MSNLPETARDGLRASDSEREATVSALREEAGEGRLEMDELAERLERAYSARTRQELAALTADLPGPPPPDPRVSRRARARRELRGHAASFVLVNLLLVAVWAATGADYFWPIWPLLGWGIGLASHAREAVDGRPRRHGGGCGRRAGHARHELGG